MVWKRFVTVMSIALLALLPSASVHAGGWASVEIVARPDTIHAGELVTLSLRVAQHGITPVDIEPVVVLATHQENGDTIEATATDADGIGAYSVDIAFPADGTWLLSGAAGGFPPFDMGPLIVGTSRSSSGIAAPAGLVTITIAGGMGSGRFDPASLEITAGTLVVWQNDSVEGHTIAFDRIPERSGLVAPGGAFALLFDQPGVYRYVCGPHPAMTGEIVVN